MFHKIIKSVLVFQNIKIRVVCLLKVLYRKGLTDGRHWIYCSSFKQESRLEASEVTYSDKTEQRNALCLCRHFVVALLNDVMTAGHGLVLHWTALFQTSNFCSGWGWLKPFLVNIKSAFKLFYKTRCWCIICLLCCTDHS